MTKGHFRSPPPGHLARPAIEEPKGQSEIDARLPPEASEGPPACPNAISFKQQEN